jgi:hypothetical protein
MLCILWPFLLNPVCWFTLDIPIFAGAIGLGVLTSLPANGGSPWLGLLIALF